MSVFEIQGQTSGEYNIKRYDFSYVVNVSSYDDSLHSVSLPTNTGGTVVMYRPSAPLKPFNNLVPNANYLINAKENFTIYDKTYWQDVFMWQDSEMWEDDEQLPPLVNYNILGRSEGAYNIVDCSFKQSPTDISTFNTSLCSVVKLNDQRTGFMIYRPNSSSNFFTQFVPDVGYIVRAKENFSLD